MDKMLEIERIAKQLEEETNLILNKNFPMDSREFLVGEDAKHVKNNDEKIVSLANLYLETYKSLQFDEQRKCDYKNIQGVYYQNTHKYKGLIRVGTFSDEYELHEAFSRASRFGMSAIDGIFDAKKNNDENMYLKNKIVLDECVNILKTHYWGEKCIASLQRYSQRLENGRTVDADLNDYKNLIQECKNLSLEYAKANIRGLGDEEKAMYFQAYNTIFDREERLTEFIPIELLESMNINLHWMKVDAERNPQKLINEEIENNNNKSL